MKYGILTLAAGAVIALTAQQGPAAAAGLVDVVRPDSNVTQIHGSHRSCDWDHGDFHRHRRGQYWEDCVQPQYAPPPPAPYVVAPTPYYVAPVAPAPVYPGPYYRRPGFSLGVTVSDERLKHDVVKLASLADGIDLYEYSLVGETERRVGVMAQEVAESAPHAVLQDPSGYLLVDYGALFADGELMSALESSGYQLAP